jgi:hypothetical protein
MIINSISTVIHLATSRGTTRSTIQDYLRLLIQYQQVCVPLYLLLEPFREPAAKTADR